MSELPLGFLAASLAQVRCQGDQNFRISWRRGEKQKTRLVQPRTIWLYCTEARAAKEICPLNFYCKAVGKAKSVTSRLFLYIGDNCLDHSKTLSANVLGELERYSPVIHGFLYFIFDAHFEA